MLEVILMLEAYWPSQEECAHCIRTDAETAAEHVLLAVHEPMTLTMRQKDSAPSGYKSEYDFLDYILSNEYPVPIIGPAGSGKSHIIRWLDAKLSVRAEDMGWHIRRIPKSASLKDVLIILLKGLEGEDFELSRQDIKSVGDKLKTDEVADHLIVFINHALTDLFNKSNKELQALKDGGKISLTPEKIQLLQRHAGGGLQALLSDPNFKPRLVDKDKCIYHLASRFMGEFDTWADGDFEDKITLDDLDFNTDFNLDDLSANARDYIRDKGLTTNTEAHQEAVNLINEVLETAMENAFSKFYQFRQGSFIDLFNDIRRHLKDQNKTLVVLVEDLASISAIKDVLLDSLLKDSTYAGVQELCSIRSVFAVTDGSVGYRAYQERSGTISSRQGGVEWYIESDSVDENNTFKRIEDFCGRYLNAARIGSMELESSYVSSANNQDWPAVWHADDKEKRDLVEQFGLSSKGYPLFPFNKAAIRSIISTTDCVDASGLKFKPRTIIIKLLNEYLKRRERYLSGDFLDFKADSQLQISTELEIALQGSLRTQNLWADYPQTMSLVTYWGYEASSIGELASVMPPAIAEVFNCNDLYGVLTDTSPVTPVTPTPVPTPVQPKGKPQTHPSSNNLADKANMVDKWFKEELIPQAEANIIRQTLRDALNSHWASYAGWAGVAENSLPTIWKKKQKGDAPPIYVHFNTNNPNEDKRLGYFGCDKKGYGNYAARYKSFFIALLRFNEIGSWDYKGGYEDYCRYQTFISDWVNSTSSDNVKKIRTGTKDAIVKQLEIALLFYPDIASMSFSKKLEICCKTQDTLDDDRVVTGDENWDVFAEGEVIKWGEQQDQWLNSFIPDAYFALDADLIKPYIRGAIDSETPVPRKTQQKIQQTIKTLKNTYGNVELIRGTHDQRVFDNLIRDIMSIVESLNTSGQYKVSSDSGMTSRQFLNLAKGISDTESWPAVKSFLEMTGDFEAKKALKNLHKFNKNSVNNLDKLLKAWREIYNQTYTRLKIENARQGSDERSAKREEVQTIINQCNGVLTGIKESLHD
jgi:hypothetical protein